MSKLDKMPVGERMRTADKIGKDLNAVLLKAQAECNEILKPWGLIIGNFEFDLADLPEQESPKENNNLDQNLNQE